MTSPDQTTVPVNPEIPAEIDRRFRIEGMTCENCANQVRQAIAAVEDIGYIRIDLASGTATVKSRRPREELELQIFRAVADAGYRASSIVRKSGEPESPAGANFFDRYRVIAALTVLAFLMLSEWLLGWHRQAWFGWLSFGLALFVQTACGRHFYLSAWRQLKQGKSNMDTLVSLGSTAALGYSAFVLVSGTEQPLYFMEAVGIVALISLGHHIEGRVSRQVSRVVETLMAMAPEKASLLRDNGTAERVPVASLVPGSRIRLAPGERVPVDARVLDGASSCDESMLTGEPVPVEKKAGQPVHAGTLNQSGTLTAVVTGTGDDTALARIIATVERAKNSRADIQRLADRICSVFVPAVLVVALTTFLSWSLFPEETAALHGLLAPWLWNLAIPSSPVAAGVVYLIAVLIVACPCAMGLATPIAVMAGTNAAAQRGILFRDGRAMERSGYLDRIVFDKTGTLTRGQPEVIALHHLNTAEPAPNDLLAALAAPSRHPLSQALANYLDPSAKEPVAWLDWKELPGKGVEAVRSAEDGEAKIIYRLGALPWLAELGIDCRPVDELISTSADTGAIIIAAAGPRGLIAVVVLNDQIKPEARKMISQLKSMGYSLTLASGDRRATAEFVGRKLELDTILAEVPPERKAQYVLERQRRGEKICFVGDGINDAPALEQADLGIAVSSASDLARESADIILLRSDIPAIPQAIRLAQATLRTIRQNLFWAFFYNAVGIPLAALGFLHPLLCAAAMGCSDLVVVGNAVRLRYRRDALGTPSLQ